MPDTSHPAPRLHVVADLRLEVGDDRGQTTAHLHDGPDGLVLDVPEPAVLLRSVPGRGLTRDLPVRPPDQPVRADLLSGLSVRLRSRGHDLGRVGLDGSGRVRLRPTARGALVATRAAMSYGAGRAVAAGALLSIGAAAAVLALRRRRA